MNEVNTVGAPVAPTSNVSDALKTINGDVAKTEASLKSLQTAMEGIRMLVPSGTALKDAILDAVAPAKECADWLSRMNSSSKTLRENAEASAAALKAICGTTLPSATPAGHGGTAHNAGLMKGSEILAGFVPGGKITFGAGMAGADGASQAQSMQWYIYRAMIDMGMKPGPDDLKTDMARQLREAVEVAAPKWGQSDIGAMEQASLAALHKLPGLSPEDRMRRLPAIMDYVGATSLGRPDVSPSWAGGQAGDIARLFESLPADKSDAILHAAAPLSVAYPELPKILGSMPEEGRSTLASSAMAPDNMLALIAAGGQTHLGRDATSGISALLANAFSPDLASAGGSEVRVALAKLGVGDAKGQGLDGMDDPLAALKTMSEHLAIMPPQDRAKALTDAGGARGAGALDTLLNPVLMKTLEGAYGAAIKHTSIDDYRDQYTKLQPFQHDQATAGLNVSWERFGEYLDPISKLASRLGTVAVDFLKNSAATTDDFQWKTGRPRPTEYDGLLKVLHAPDSIFEWALGHAGKGVMNIGSAAARGLFGDNDGNAKGSPILRQALPPPPPPPTTVKQPVTMKINEREIGKAVVEYQVREMSRPWTAPPRHDPRMSIPNHLLPAIA
jgi:hypothetical protein